MSTDDPDRILAANAIESFFWGDSTNDHLEMTYPVDSRDSAVMGILLFVSEFFDDFRTYRFKDLPSIRQPEIRTAERCLLFLRSGLEYSWPSPGPLELLLPLTRRPWRDPECSWPFRPDPSEDE